MLNLYRRHQPPCTYTTRRNRNCNCAIWVQGSLRGEYIRRGLNLRSWSAATDLVRDWEAAGEIGVVKRVEVPTIAEAVDKFFVDAKAQHLSHETIRKYENLLNKRLLPWCEGQGLPLSQAARVEEIGLLVEINCEEPAGLVCQQRVHTHYVATGQVPQHGGIVSRKERLVRTLRAFDFGQLAHATDELVPAAGA